jgi:hypothetical protein
MSEQTDPDQRQATNQQYKQLIQEIQELKH